MSPFLPYSIFPRPLIVSPSSPFVKTFVWDSIVTIDKTILIGNPRLLRNIATALSTTFSMQQLEHCDIVKNLGLIQNISFNYTTETCKQVFFRIHTIKCSALYLPINFRLLVVQTLYCLTTTVTLLSVTQLCLKLLYLPHFSV